MTTAVASRFLDLRALAALGHLRFATRQQIEGTYSGRHRSKQQGGAGEFVDFREYVEGEDLRRLDWKVYARTNRAYIRLYQDETNLLCTLALDVSGSMGFAGRKGGAKLEYAQYLATALSYLISGQQDQVGLAVVGEKLEEYLEPGSTATHVARLQERVAALQAQGESGVGAGLRDLFQRTTRRGVLLLMSDFLVDDLEELFGAVRLFRHRHWEVVALHLVHPEEERLPEGLAYRFFGLEGEGHVDCSPADVRRLYEERFANHGAMVRSLALAAGCDYRRISSGVSYLDTLGGFLVERAG